MKRRRQCVKCCREITAEPAVIPAVTDWQLPSLPGRHPPTPVRWEDLLWLRRWLPLWAAALSSPQSAWSHWYTARVTVTRRRMFIVTWDRRSAASQSIHPTAAPRPAPTVVLAMASASRSASSAPFPWWTASPWLIRRNVSPAASVYPPVRDI